MPEWSARGSAKVSAGVFCKASIEDGKLSISGVVGPLSSGNALGSCGQIDSSIKEALNAGELSFAPEWSTESVRKLLAVWDVWHLNDMQAGCEHQRSNGWSMEAVRKVKIYQWKLKPEVSAKQSALKDEAIERASSTDSTAQGFGPEEKRIMRLEYSIKTTAPELAGYDLKYYEASADKNGYFAHVEEKALGWLSPEEHPEGILGKACEVCGYKYGTAWMKAELPADVVEFIENMPEASRKPVWV